MTVSSPTKHLLLFGDNSVGCLPAIQTLVRASKSSPAAKRFLQEATDLVQLEFSKLSKQEHGWDKGFDTLLELAQDYNDASGTNLLISVVLTCVGRLGHLIVSAHEDATVLGSPLEPVEIVALCGGLLPAAVAWAAQDTSQLFPLSRMMISVSFRLALEVRRRMRLVEDRQESWGRTYTGISRDKVQAILNEFHQSQNFPRFRNIAIGVVADDWLSLVGPPSSLARLESWSHDIKNASSLETDISGPMHSPWVPKIDIARVLGDSPLLHHRIDLAKAKMISPGSCVRYKHLTLGLLLGEIIEDIAYNVLNVTASIKGCVSNLDRKCEIKLTVMGPTNHLAAMKETLRTHGVEYQLTQHGTSNNNEEARGGSDLIAIVGMSGRFPGSETIEGFWEDLVAGKCQIKEVPKSRFDVDAYFDSTGSKKNSTTSRHGAFIDDPGLFDHRLFNVSPREAAQMDPNHRLIQSVVYEALQSAGYSSGGSLSTGSSRIATYFGQAAEEWRDILHQKGADIYYVPGLQRSFGPGRLNFHYKWGGSSLAIDSACSTSATAISLACSALIARECDMALAGGVSVITSPITFAGLSRAGMLSTAAGCRTFHDDADGYSRGEGAGAVVLKRLEDAVFENDNILAVIRGSARAYSSTSTSITHPSAASQQATFSRVLKQSCLDPEEIAYVEMHGTGTQAGDVAEMTSIIRGIARQRSKDNPLTVGAVKAAVGHGEGAAGVTSLIKAVMMLRERQIPPQPGCPFKVNRNFPESSIKIAMKPSKLLPSPNGDKKVKVLVNSFDASGGIVTLVVEEPPSPVEKVVDPRSWHTVALSARTAVSLQNNRLRLLEYLERNPETKLADLAYTTTARRIHEPLRLAYTGRSIRDIVRQLRNEKSEVPKTRPKAHSCVFLFTGQGSQYAGMGVDLFRESQTFREMLLGYQEMATGVGLPQFIDLICKQELDMPNQSTTKVQLAIVALEIAVARTLESWGITPDVVIGHSLGEYSALCIAGVLSVSDVLVIVGSRAALMERSLPANTYAMLATSVNESFLQELFKEMKLDSCCVACVNTPSNTVVSGTLQDIRLLEAYMSKEGERTTLLRVPYGFHSSQLEPILEGVLQVAKGVHFSKPRIPIVSTLTGRVELDGCTFSPAYLLRQTRKKVDFLSALETCQAEGLCDNNTLWVEVGPDPVCLGLARRTLNIPASHSLPTLKSGENNWCTVSNALKKIYESGHSVNWVEFHKSYQSSVALLNLPSYAFDYTDFWSPYKEPELPSSYTSDHVDSEAMIVAPQLSGFPTPSLQQVGEETIHGSTITTTFYSRISDKRLLEAIEGHIVNGKAVCPLGIFHDMALTASKYAYVKMHPNSKLPDMVVHNMDITSALVANEDTLDSLICVKSSYCSETKLANIEFHSRNGDKSSRHGTCTVAFGESYTWKKSLSQTLFLLESRIKALADQASSGKAHRLLKPVAYQLFSSVVSYSSRYQAMEEVVMDTNCNDAVATVKLCDIPGSGQFHTSPYWIDSVTHLAGFVLNSSLRYTQDVACLALGFDTWRSITDLRPGENYTTYVCMQEVPNSQIISGDCYVFHGKELVQASLGITFLKVKKVALNTILGIADPVAHRPQQRVTGAETDTGNIGSAATLSIQLHGNQKPIRPSPPSSVGNERTMSQEASELPTIQVFNSILAIVATESGCTLDDMTDDTRYLDLGVDSVMAITILSKVRRNVGVDLPAAFLMDNETIGESRASLKALFHSDVDTDSDMGELDATLSQHSTLLLSPSSCLDTPCSSRSSVSISCVADSDGGDIEAVQTQPKQEVRDKLPQKQVEYVSKITHYQGSRSFDSKKLFFIADETGSTFGYIQFPSLGPSLGVYGVESPFTKTMASVDMDVQQLASIYQAAIQKEQPSGPYMLGGISAGSVLAFEVARRLLAAGESVETLLIMDCESPRIQDIITNYGNGGVSSIGRVKASHEEHKRIICSVFSSYNPAPLPPLRQPKVTLQIIARHTLGTSAGQPDGVAWVDMIPELQTRVVDIESGSFLKISMVNILGQVCKEAIQGPRERVVPSP